MNPATAGFFFLGVALVATIAANLFVTRSCARMAERTTDVPAEA